MLVFSIASSMTENDVSGDNLSYVEMASSFGFILGNLFVYSLSYLGIQIPYLVSILLDLFVVYLTTTKLNLDMINFNYLDDNKITNLINSDNIDNVSNSIENSLIKYNIIKSKFDKLIVNNSNIINNNSLNISISLNNIDLNNIKNNNKLIVHNRYHSYHIDNFNDSTDSEDEDEEIKITTKLIDNIQSAEDNELYINESVNIKDNFRKKSSICKDSVNNTNASIIYNNNNISLYYNSEINDINKGFLHNENNDINIKNLNDISFISIILSKDVLLTIALVIADFICQSFYGPIFTLLMHKNFNFNANQCSSVLVAMSVSFLAFLKFTSYFINKFSAKYVLCLGLLFNSLSTLMMNPISIFPFNSFISIFGFCLLNAIAGFISVSSIVDFSKTLNKMGFNEIISNDYASALYMYAINIGDLIGPVIGASLNSYYGFLNTSIIVGFINLIFSLMFFCFNLSNISLYLKKVNKANKAKY